ncbi:MAG: diguanylate cyclase [Sulfurimonas sp.]
MNKNISNLKIINGTKTMLSVLCGIIAFVVVLFLFMGHLHHQFVLETIVKEEQNIASKIYSNTLKNIEERYESIAINLLMNKDIINAFEKQDRNKLLTLTEPIYKKLNEQNPYLKIMHFHTKDTKSFLRVHQPQKFGDDLTSIRHLINQVNNMKTKQKEIEVGRYGVSYRLVFPIFNDSGDYLGAFEFGIDINYILDIFNKDYNFQSILLLKKDSFDILYENNKNITYSKYSNDYYSIESNFSCATSKKCNSIEDSISSNAPYMVEDNNNDSVIFTANTIKNITNDEIGKILFIKNINFYTHKIEIIKYLSIASALILLIITVYLIRRILNNYINMIDSYQSRIAIKHRTLLKLSNIDHLTKINNRKSIENILIKELKRVERYNQKLSLIILDIDNFKKINDTYGHNIGDSVLKNIAKIVSSTIRETDYFGRWGGEEFVIVSTETSLDNAFVIAEKVRQNIYSYNFEEVKKVSCSIGVTEYTEGDTNQTIVNNADTALYEAKNSGKNKVVVYKVLK